MYNMSEIDCSSSARVSTLIVIVTPSVYRVGILVVRWKRVEGTTAYMLTYTRFAQHKGLSNNVDCYFENMVFTLSKVVFCEGTNALV